jgi:hypothetical protein
MNRAVVVILLAFTAQAQEADDVTDKMFDRANQASPFWDNLDRATLGKASSLAAPAPTLSSAKAPSTATLRGRVPPIVSAPVVDMSRRDLAAAVLGSMLIAGQAAEAVPVSSYVSKCDKATGKCPPLIETLKAQGDENKDANKKARMNNDAARSYVKATRLGQPYAKEKDFKLAGKQYGDLWQNFKDLKVLGKNNDFSFFSKGEKVGGM